ncbi:electron transport complex subunit RsxG [Thiosulfativibrio zosterae]|uniref:Ion-translocating oxidoreductase complex subunit G n=1 Tax=Thiosulfativibrio zosterae TaxID=2675053 RepID=A0A6F8PMR0_9GAMM|nr:electron transport complex subunit RsxG [Thiosulfativibrio zosterae]BBP43376.1 electron transport complex subunit G [Thiosulfativibrio zosterae]
MSQPNPIPSKTLWQQMAKSAVSLSLFTLVGVGLLLGIRFITAEPIAIAQKQTILDTFNQVMPPENYNNDPLLDTKQIIAPEFLGTSEPVTLYRVRKDGQPTGVILQTIAPDGYSGDIHILMGVLADGRIAGVRVLEHKETPGLGDKIEIKKSQWIRTFDGRNLRDENAPRWRVRKDGGDFDQFTGATITPRAVVKAVRNTLDYLNQHRDALYD